MNNSRETFGLMGHLCVEIYVSKNRKCSENVNWNERDCRGNGMTAQFSNFCAQC